MLRRTHTAALWQTEITARLRAALRGRSRAGSCWEGGRSGAKAESRNCVHARLPNCLRRPRSSPPRWCSWVTGQDDKSLAPMGAKTPLPRFVTHARSLQSLRSRLCNAWVLAAVACTWSLYVFFFPSHACPPGHLCVPNSVGGSPSTATPYIEFSEVTSSAECLGVARVAC